MFVERPVRCDDGRGVVMTDIGFERLQGDVRTNVPAGSTELSSRDEPRITGVRSAGQRQGGCRRETSARLLASHLTPENHRAVLELAPHKSRREVEELIAGLGPSARPGQKNTWWFNTDTRSRPSNSDQM